MELRDTLPREAYDVITAQADGAPVTFADVCADLLTAPDAND